MDFTIRQMTGDDLPAVAEIEAGVFTDWYRIHRREPAPLPERTLDELAYATSLDPRGNLVAVAADGSMVGFLLARTWGSVGWFGTFGVPTQFQGLGIGKALVRGAMDYLAPRTSVIGLETMPESGANIGLYTKLGFVVTYPTVILELSLVHEADRLKGVPPEDVEFWSDEGAMARASVLREIRAISDALFPGLDYSREVEAVRTHGLGRTVLSRGAGGRLDGFAVVRTTPYRVEDTSGRAYLHIVGIRPGAPVAEVVDDLLRQVWTAATALGLSRVTTGVTAGNQDALVLLIESGFRAVRAAIRMIHRSAPDEIFRPSENVDVSRWAG